MRDTRALTEPGEYGSRNRPGERAQDDRADTGNAPAPGAETPQSAGVYVPMATPESVRRRKRRFIGLIVLLVALAGGWSAFWFYAASQAQQQIAGWRAREAKAGRIYTCGQQTLARVPVPHRGRLHAGGGPASRAAACRSTSRPSARIVVAQIYSRNLLIAEIDRPAHRRRGRQGARSWSPIGRRPIRASAAIRWRRSAWRSCSITRRWRAPAAGPRRRCSPPTTWNSTAASSAARSGTSR